MVSHISPQISAYAGLPHHFDEMIDAAGSPRPHWSGLVDFLDHEDAESLARRWEEGRRIIEQNGITYNVYGDPLSVARPWPLDPIPLLMGSSEWASIEAAIVQRATLINAILADIYGPQKLLLDRRLPADLILAHPSFLRPCHQIRVPGNTYLHTYAADIARSPDGQWWVIADRTQAPSGTGYALENRMVSTRTLPDLLARSNIQPLLEFFQAQMATLLAAAPGNRENPRVVLLTPGPYNETYFEHAYLARHLGISLVEGGDLVVRDRRVHLKTLGGLLPIDVILRRQDDTFCDPLELRADSLLGVPGLLQVMREGRVIVANMLGSGIAETPALAAFLPGLCKHLLGEPLKMPSVATWWCGQEVPCQFVLEHPEGLVIKRAMQARREPPVFLDGLDKKERAAFLDRLRAHPNQFVAQEQVALSTTPVWSDKGLLPRHLVLRVHAVCSNGTYSVLPGGLARFSTSKDSMVVSVQRGGGSKDTWVVGDGPVSAGIIVPTRAHPLDINRATIDLPSRVADNLFWLGRYAERVDFAVRLCRAAFVRIARESGHDSDLPSIGRILAGLGYIDEPEGESLNLGEFECELDGMITDPQRRGGLLWTVTKMHRVGWLLRDRISNDAWLVITRLTQKFSEPMPEPPFRRSALIDLMDRSLLRLSAFGGYVMESMTRGPGWRFLDIGRRIERAVQVLDLLRFGLVTSGGENEPEQIETLLEISDTLLTYRSRYLSSMQPDLLADLLLLDEANPRSVAFQLARLQEHVQRLPAGSHIQGDAEDRARREHRAVLAALSEVRLVELDQLMQPDRNGERVRLEAFLNSVSMKLKQFSDQLNRSYLIHTLPLRQTTIL